MLQIALWPGNAMKMLRCLFKDTKILFKEEQQTDALLVFSASPTVYKNVHWQKKQSAMHQLNTFLVFLFIHLFSFSG